MKQNSKLVMTMRKAAAAAALKVTKSNANSTCAFFTHQPKLPENAKKLRKF